jgi:hypothetical protein
MKIGTIIRNDWAGDKNPGKYFVYCGIVGKYATGVYVENGKLVDIKFNKYAFKNDGKFVDVGHCDFIGYIKGELDDIKDGRV